MANIPYTPNPSSIPKFLDHIQGAGVPPRVNREYLQSVGFKSSNDRYLISVFKAVDFLDASGQPTPRWREFRDRKRAGRVLAEGLRKGYVALFETYPDAHRKDKEAIRNFFASKTNWGADTLERAVSTFKTLCATASFEEEVGSDVDSSPAPITTAPAAASVGAALAQPAINLNIQLELPATNDADVYEKLFAAMRKHLFVDAPTAR